MPEHTTETQVVGEIHRRRLAEEAAEAARQRDAEVTSRKAAKPRTKSPDQEDDETKEIQP